MKRIESYILITMIVIAVVILGGILMYYFLDGATFVRHESLKELW